MLRAPLPAAHAYTFTAYDAPGGPAGSRRVRAGRCCSALLPTDKTLGPSTLQAASSAPAVADHRLAAFAVSTLVDRAG